MSINPDETICVTVKELYLALWANNFFGMGCDALERLAVDLSRGKTISKRQIASAVVWSGLLAHTTRSELKKRIMNIGYRESYAERLLTMLLGEFSKHEIPDSRTLKSLSMVEKSAPERDYGRPRIIYGVRKIDLRPTPASLDRLGVLCGFLSGNLRRLILAMYRLLVFPAFREAICELLRNLPSTFSLPTELEAHLENLKPSEIEAYLAKINEAFDNRLEPVERAALDLLPGNPSPEDKAVSGEKPHDHQTR